MVDTRCVYTDTYLLTHMDLKKEKKEKKKKKRKGKKRKKSSFEQMNFERKNEVCS